jgi:PTS system beta-glucosides-specific IIC component
MADLKKTGVEIFNIIGGNDNIVQMTHCATRLRFQVKDKGKVDVTKLKKVSGVLDVVEQGGQIQVIIGPDVQIAFRAAEALFTGMSGDQIKETKKSLFERFMTMMMAIINPMVPSIMGAGMVKAVIALLRVGENLGWYNGITDSSTFAILDFIADSAFFFMPMILAFSSAQFFKANVGLAVTLAGVLLHPRFIAMRTTGNPINFIGLPVPLVNYASTLVPIILSVFVQSLVEKWSEKHLPTALKYVVRPMLVLLIVAPISLIVLGPIGYYIGFGLAALINTINTHASWLVPTILGSVYPLLIMVGIHGALAPIAASQLASMGHETVIGPAMLPSNIAQAGASFAVALKSKKGEMRQAAISAGISALMGITEPALFGVTLKLKKPLIAVMIGGGVAGFFAGIMKLVRYSFGSPGIPTLPVFIGENPMNFFKALATMAISFGVTFLITLFLKYETGDEDHAEKTNNKAEVKTAPGHAIITSPVSGRIVPLGEVQDDVFSKEVLGKGIAIIPEENQIIAPFDGTVNVYDSKHAIGIASDDGIELLIHVGLNTVELEGRHFECGLKTDDRVKKGDILIGFDKEAIQKEGYPIITPVIVTNSDAFSVIEDATRGTVKTDQPLLNLKGENA